MRLLKTVGVYVLAIPTLYAQTADTWTVLTPVAAGRATVGGFFPMENAFDAQPSWDGVSESLVGSTGGVLAPYYTNRHGYIDLGPNYAALRIMGTWTQYRAWSGGDHDGYVEVWWDDDNDEINDNGIVTTAINFNSAQGVSNIGSSQWVQDKDHSSSPITPPMRYLILRSPAVMSARADEYAIVGYATTSSPPPAVTTYLVDLGNPATPTAGHWNNVTANQSNGTRIDNLVNTSGGMSGISLVVVSEADNGYGLGEGFNPDGYNGEALGYPATACSDSYFAHGVGGTYQLTSLQGSMQYTLKLFGSRMAATGGRVGSYTINGVTQTLDGQNNTTQQVVFENLQAAADGTLTLEFGVAAGSTFGYINVLELVESPTMSSGAVADALELAALRELYEGTTGPGWTTATGWPANAAEWAAVTSVDQLTGWHGVTVTDGDVTQLDLRNNGLNGTIPATLSDLLSLTRLYLDNNQLTGAIPAGIFDLASLTHCHLSGNGLTGPIPSNVGNAVNLQSLVLAANSLTGGIPAGIGNLVHCEQLNLEGNALGGTIPVEIGGMTQLTYLNLANCNLSGEIPDFFGSLPSLYTVSLGFNNLSGSLPTSLGTLVNLQVLGVSFNALSGPIPTSFSNLASLVTFNVDDNRLTGAVPGYLAGVS
ncbi:MAG: hypothetical protein MJA30_19910, partial [Cytophagales bacterium]|nr:hypothetical protein [Cytophagales bacterium]